MKQHARKTTVTKIFKPLVLSIFLFLLIAAPRPATAQITVLGDVQRVVQGSTGILDVILKGLETSAQVALKNGLRTFFDQIAYDTAVWIGSGDNNQKPLLFTKDAGTYLAERGDAAIGEVLDTIGEGAGIDLCNLPQAQGLRVELQVNRLFDIPEAPSVYQADCSVTQIAASAQNSFESLDNTFTEAKIQFAANPQSIIGYYQGLFPKNNPALAVLDAQQKIAEEKGKAENAAAIERLKSDYKDKTGKVAGTVETPAAVVEQNSNLAAEKSAEGETTLTGNVFADSLNIFANTLLSKLMDKAQSGLLSFFTQSDINESLRGSSSTSRGGGIREARLQFASYKTPPISSSGTLDILSQFATCPTEGADVTNCVITDEFRTAIDQQKTVKQLVEETNIGNLSFGLDPNGSDITDPNQGISVRNVKILRQYSVVPVGWELAAEYRKNYAAGTNVTLRQVMDEYEKCTTDNYSPYCGLIDPDWVLKAPEVFCKVDGYAENIGATSFIDNDGNPYTPQQLQVNRLKSCVDAQTCLSEDDTGACEAYGYCTKQEDIYRFEGESCPAHQASCEVFTDPTGAQVGYLKNTLNYNGCSSESDGCAWRCSVYNTVDQEFQCNGEDSIYNTCTSANGCSTNLVQADGSACSAECTIANGGFRCSAEDQTCYLSGSATNTQYSINFDNDIQPCNEADQSCATFIPQVGSNLIANPSFERFFNGDREPQAAAVSTDPFGQVALAFAEADGSPCLSDEAGGGCYGWQQPAGGPGWRVVTDAASGKVAVESESDSSADLTTKIDTGYSVANRSFALSYKYLNTSGRTCEDQGTARAIISTTDTRVGRTDRLQYPSSSDYQIMVLDPYTFPANVTNETVQVTIGAPRDCNLIIDDVALIEITNTTTSTAYQDYGANAVHLKTTVAEQCSPDEIGCQLYTPQTGASRLAIPGRVTNPLSEACGNGANFSNPACSQCFQQFVGCQAFVEEPTPYQAPLKEFAPGLEDSAAAIAKRTGFYCEGTATSCSPNRAAVDCGAGVACIPSISLTPSTGDSCSAQDVGCEQYVNIDKQGAGGESLEYYSYIRQCVKPTTTQIENGLVDTYYSFEGSDQTGYQIRSWYLKKSNQDAGPCTNLDLTGGTAQSADAACVDTADNQAVCSAAELGSNPNCTEYFDKAGTRYYRLRTATITVSESCTALRNSQDSRIYYTIPAESQTCSASANLCREYKGSAGNNERFIIDEQFDGTMWGGGTSSSTVASANNGQSMQIGSSTASSAAATPLPADITAEKSYVSTFWAKGDAGQTLTVFVNSPSSGVRQTFGTVTLTGEWQRYSVGPFVSQGPLSGDSEFGFSYNGTAVYIDNVQVFENNSVYMIAGSAETCNGFEGCQQYNDQNGQTTYIKSFEKLCDENDAGCTAVFNTQNSSSPFTERFNTDNEGSSDDVIVSADRPEARIIKPEAFCDASVASCTALGLPAVSADGSVSGFTKEFFLNDPDFYSNSLCTDEQLSCQAYAAQDGSIQYFKNPGNKLCNYDEGAGEWKTADGDPCPLQNPADQPSQPKGPVCNNGPREGELCSTDAECPTADDGSPSRCVSDLNNDSGWVGQCNPVFAGCTNYLDPNSESVDVVVNTSFETDVLNNNDQTDRSPDQKPDNWKESVRDAAPYIGAVGLRGYGCDIATSSEEQVADGKKALKLQAINDFEYVCSVEPAQQVAVDPNKIYALRGYAWPQGGAKFGIGLRFFDASGNEIRTADNAATDYAIAAFGGSNRGVATENAWTRYYGMIGPSMNHTFPTGTVRVAVFVEHSGTGSVLFDSVEFAEVEQYSYINSSVDGAPQSDTNTCNGTVDEGQGCVAFQDTTNLSNTYLSAQAEAALVTGSGDAFAPAPCQTRASDGQIICDGTANAADANVVIQVKRDRQCAEWIACSGTNVTNINGQIVTTCQALGTCKKRNPDTGICSEWVLPPSANSIDSLDVIKTTSQPGDPSTVAQLRNYSGFVKAGMEWIGDGAAQSVGYYPADWMPQRGLATAPLTQELIPDHDFENVTCSGSSGSSEDALQQAANAARDTSARCTLDIHCRVQATETAVQTKLAADNPSDQRVSDIQYEQGWCNNVQRDGGELQWNDWRSYGNAEMGIVDYDDAYQFVSPDTGQQPDTLTSLIVGAKSLNLNNVMVVQPVGNRESGLQVTLPDSGLFENGQEFVLSFDAKYLREPATNPDGTGDALTVGLYYGGSRGADNQDFFTDDPDTNPFRFTTEMQTYTFGPLIISNHDTVTDAVTLFVAQITDASNAPFIIDNVSLRPALEVSAEGGVAGNKVDSDIVSKTPNPKLISRSCRAYPNADSVSCNYTDTTGAIYTGWKGYCLEGDTLRKNGCIAWWPVDTLAGESDLLRASIKMRYTDQAPAYHCLVAKGNENVGACSERGDACTTRSDCGTGELCYGNEPVGQCKNPQGGLVEDDTCDDRAGCVPYDDPDTADNDHNVLCNVDTDCAAYGAGSECEIPDESLLRFSEQNAYTTDYEFRSGTGYTDTTLAHEYLTQHYTMRHRIPSIFIDQDTHTDTAGTDQPREREEAFFRKFTNLPIEKQLHISEISNIIVNLGEGNAPGSQANDVRGAKNSWNIDGAITETSLAKVEEDGNDPQGTTALEVDGEPALWKVQAIGKDDEAGVANMFNDAGNDAGNAGVTAAQYGLWCGDKPCNTLSTPAELQNADFVVVKGTSNKADNDATGSILFGAGRIYNNGNYFNPFERFADVMGVGTDEDTGADIWSRSGRIGGTTGNTNQIGSYTIENNDFFKYFAGRNIRDIDADFDNTTTTCWNSQICGANIQAVNLDFEDGYLRAAYVVVFNGFKRYDVYQIRNFFWTFELKEPCVLAVKSAARTDQSVQVTPWRTRIQPTSGYTIPDLGYSYQLQSSSGSKKYSNVLFGDLGVGDLFSTQWGSDKRTGKQHTTGAAGQLPLVYTNQNSGLPFSCIGECSENVCQNTSPYSDSLNQFDTFSCEQNLWVSVEGVCTTVPGGETYISPTTQQAIPCDVRANDANDTCPVATQCTGLDGSPYNLERKGGAGSTYAQELRNAVRTGWANYRNIFAGLADGTVYLAQPRNATQLQLHQEVDGEVGGLTVGSILDEFTLQQLQAYDDADPSVDNRAIAEIGTILNEFQNMDLCPAGTNDQGDEQYCAIRPTVSNVRLNGQESGTIEIAANQATTLEFRSRVDRDQEPLNTIQIQWQGKPGEGFDETTPSDSWEAASGDHVYTHIYTCNPSPENDVQFVNGACEYEVRIRIRDNWGTCNGTDSPADRRDSCDSFTEAGFLLRVTP
jgi:hypothetical protein